MHHKLPNLPYPKHALEPYLSAEMLEQNYRVAMQEEEASYA